ncbi:MAG: ribbon-helix-helix domain-containing protein [Acidobacteria bacterium]|nr:ribbon-helix-helix domain-containing protein [Acidobacteriota bacterium]
MRTTITLDDRLLTQLKKRAAESGTSVSRLIEQAIHLFMRTPVSSKRPHRFEVVTFGAGCGFSRQNIDKTSALLETDDVDRFAKRK